MGRTVIIFAFRYPFPVLRILAPFLPYDHVACPLPLAAVVDSEID